MNRHFLSLLLVLKLAALHIAFAQKPALTYKDYPQFDVYLPDQATISPDGKYSAYLNRAQSFTAIVKSSDGKTMMKIPRSSTDLAFTGNNFLIFRTGADSLCVADPIHKTLTYEQNVSGFELLTNNAGEWLLETYSGAEMKVDVKQLRSGKKFSFQNVKHYTASTNKQVILFNCGGKLVILDLKNCVVHEIFEGNSVTHAVICNSGIKSAFIVKDSSGTSIYTYVMGNPIARKCIKDKKFGEIVDFYFTRDDERLVLKDKIQREPEGSQQQIRLILKNASNGVSRRLGMQNAKNLRTTIIDFFSTESVSINEPIVALNKSSLGKILICKAGWSETGFEKFWLKRSDTLSVLSIFNRKKQIIAIDSNSFLYSISSSPDDKFVVYYDKATEHFYSFEIETGIKRLISKNVVGSFSQVTGWERSEKNWPYGIAGWSTRDQSVLIYTEFDIWKLSLKGNLPPKCLTVKKKTDREVAFRFALNNQDYSGLKKILLNAFNHRNKDNGFYLLDMISGKLDSLTMSPHVYHLADFTNSLLLEARGTAPVKARGSEIYLLSRASVTRSVNYYTTKDFKLFTGISNSAPEKNFNWMTSELVRWESFDSTPLEGILYKPENFDPRKKYPIIFYYYEHLSDGLNRFLVPDYSDGTLPIPEYVSNGYLVFVPNINYKIGQTRKDVYNSVVSAARHLGKNSWVDTTKMGIQGHSLGGYETNVLVTYPGIFAAAVSAAGASDLTHSYGLDRFNSELGSYRLGKTPWEDPQMFVENSPVYFADKVTTPILINVGSKDERVPPQQGRAFFNMLERLNKPAWLLEYTDQGHGVGDDARFDFTIRMRQFFDHYLKGGPAPDWMQSISSATYSKEQLLK